MKLSIPKPTSEMLPAIPPAMTATKPSRLFQAIVKYSSRFPRSAIVSFESRPIQSQPEHTNARWGVLEIVVLVVIRRLHSLTLACGWHRIVDPTVSMGVQLAYGQGGTNSASHRLGRDSGPRCSCLLEVSRACPRGLAKGL